MPRATLSQIEIAAPDPVRAAAFVRHVFGWESMTVPWEGPAYVRMLPPEPTEPVGVGILAPDETGIVDRLTIVVRIEGEPLASVLARVCEAGGTVALDPIPIGASGLYARFFDPDHNSFGLWQEIDAVANATGAPNDGNGVASRKPSTMKLGRASRERSR
jgi:predicted enzyme related to lactoylglutathione lyase